MSIQIIFALFGFLFLLISIVIIDKLPFKRKLLKKFPKVRWLTFSLSIVLFLISGYFYFSNPILINPIDVVVTPKTVDIYPEGDQTFIMKLTNNKNITVYAAHVLIKIISGKLTANHIKIEPLGEREMPSIPSNSKGKVTVTLDVIVQHAIPRGSNLKEPIWIDMIVNSISPNTTRDFKVTIKSAGVKETSKINLKVSQISTDPDSVIKGNHKINN